MRAHITKRVLAALVLLGLAACGQPGSPAQEDDMAHLSEPTRQRILDLVAINESIQRYHAEHGVYPPSVNWQGYASFNGASLGANWIPELDLQPLPRDPAMSEDPHGPQYLYISNNNDYKLIAYLTGDCGPQVEVRGVRIDPARRGYENVPCSSYGFWSDALSDY
ncbi:MAG: hypothetical protein AB7H66_01110 [Hyphomonadaceae bacterium]